MIPIHLDRLSTSTRPAGDRAALGLASWPGAPATARETRVAVRPLGDSAQRNHAV
ncbi:MAG: hypothetical protein ACOCYV_02730 [Planctomycetota bacterium]